MAQILDLGKLRFNFSGDWNSSTEYEFNDVVRYGGNLYVYTYGLKTSANLPTNYTYWMLLIEGFDYVGTWSPSTQYLANQIVNYGGKVYIALEANTGETPGVSGGSGFDPKWAQLVDGIQYEGAWDSGTSYQKNDVVVKGGISYIAKIDSTDQEPPNATYWDVFVSGIQYEGEYDGGTEYQKNDVVFYDGSSYVAIQDTVGNSPSNATYWAILAQGTFPSFIGNENAVLTTNGTIALWTQDISLDTVEATDNLYVGANAKSQWENSGAKTYTVTNKSKTSNIVTLTTSTNHTLGEFQFITVALDPADPDFDGEHEIIDVTANTLTYEAVGSDVSSTATGGTVGAVTGYTNSVAHFYIDADDYAQVSFRNASDAQNASTDFIAYASNGDDFAGYIDMGITSENFGDPEFTITGPNDGYIFMDAPVGTTGAGNLVLATGARGTENKIVFAAGGLDSDSTQMEITPDLNVHIEIPTPSVDATTGALTVVGGVGVQGDLNIAGNVDIVGTITFGGEGTNVTTNNLAVTDPLVFTGTNNINDLFDLGLVGEYTTLRESPINAQVTNKQLTDNVATLTTSIAHGFSSGQVVVIADVDSTFDGTYVIKQTPTDSTFTYDKVAGNVSSTAVTPNGTATVTRDRKWGGVVRDASDNKIKLFLDASIKPGNSVDFSQSGLDYADMVVNQIEATGLSLDSGELRVTHSTDAYFTTSGNNLALKNSSGTDLFAIDSTGAITASALATLNGGMSATGNVTISGRLDVQEIREDVIDGTISSGILTADYSLSNIFYLTASPAANFTVNLTNAPTDNGKTFTVTVVVPQGATGRIPSAFQIEGVSQTLRWIFGATPIPTNGAGKIDVFNFTLIRRADTWLVMGNASTNF